MSATLGAMLARPPEPAGDPDRDHLVVLRNISWEQYVEICDSRMGARPLLAYLDGTLEIVVTSMRHELTKKLLARFVEAYCEERDVSANGAGNTTFRQKAKAAGVEADECYFIGNIGKAPDLAIEIVFTSGGVDKLEIYRRLGVREVWFWIDNKIWIYELVGKQYEPREASVVIPGIDLADVQQRITVTEQNAQTEAVRAYRRSLQGS